MCSYNIYIYIYGIYGIYGILIYTHGNNYPILSHSLSSHHVLIVNNFPNVRHTFSNSNEKPQNWRYAHHMWLHSTSPMALPYRYMKSSQNNLISVW